MSKEELKKLQCNYHQALREYLDTRYEILDASTEARDKVKASWHKYYLARDAYRQARDNDARLREMGDTTPYPSVGKAS